MYECGEGRWRQCIRVEEQRSGGGVNEGGGGGKGEALCMRMRGEGNRGRVNEENREM